MAATIQIDNIRATVTDLVWACEDKAVEKVLNSLTKLCKLDPDGAWQGGGANPDYFCAEWMVKHFPGQRQIMVVEFDVPDAPEFDEHGQPIVY